MSSKLNKRYKKNNITKKLYAGAPSPFSQKSSSNLSDISSLESSIHSLSVILSNPYAIAAAVGSLIILIIFKPAIVPASFVAALCASLK